MLVAPNKKVEPHFKSHSELKIQRGPSIEQRKQLAQRYKLTIAFVGTLDSFRSHRAESDALLVHALHPQLQKKTLQNVYRVNKSRSLKQILQSKLRTQQQRINELRQKEEAKHKEIVKARKMVTREKERALQENRRERERSQSIQHSWRQKTEERQRSESAFLLTTHRESIGMLKRSKRIQSQSQRSLVEEQFRETLRSSRYDQERKKLQKKKEKYQQEYRKAFLKNTPPPQQDLPDGAFYATLRERAEQLTQIYVLPKHLPSIGKKGVPQAVPRNFIPGIEQELMISPMRPAGPKNKRPKIAPNPEIVVTENKNSPAIFNPNPNIGQKLAKNKALVLPKGGPSQLSRSNLIAQLPIQKQ